MGGSAEDIALQAKEIVELKQILGRLMSDYTGQPFEKIIEDSERDFYMNAEAALSYGIIDHVAKPGEKTSTSPKQLVETT